MLGLERYPKTITIDDGTTVELRPLERDDESRLWLFFQSIPEADRYWLREDVGDRNVIARWVEELNYDRVFPLVAVRKGAIVADATLHRRGFGARSHIGEVRIVVTPLFRRKGLAAAMISELIDLAVLNGLDRLVSEMAAESELGALMMAQQLGFEQAAVIPDHLIGQDGRRHDLLMVVLPLHE
jgi:L-amino acid N-acyltransferase YncA